MKSATVASGYKPARRRPCVPRSEESAAYFKTRCGQEGTHFAELVHLLDGHEDDRRAFRSKSTTSRTRVDSRLFNISSGNANDVTFCCLNFQETCGMCFHAFHSILMHPPPIQPLRSAPAADRVKRIRQRHAADGRLGTTRQDNSDRW